MYGDFSKWPLGGANIVGPLQQQGRVLLDTQQNAATSAMRRWQDETARATFGHSVAAVPSWARDAFKIERAEQKNDASGTKQIFVAILGCTATLIFAFLPLLALPGTPGKFIRVLPMAVVATIIGSLLYRLAVQFALSSGAIGLRPSDLSLITAVLVAVAMVLPQLRLRTTRRLVRSTSRAEKGEAT